MGDWDCMLLRKINSYNDEWCLSLYKNKQHISTSKQDNHCHFCFLIVVCFGQCGFLLFKMLKSSWILNVN